MDGQVISGCGNIYATEALFAQKIHPARKMNRISEKRKRALFEEIVAVLRQSIEAGGSTISDYRNINGEAGSMQNRLKMYGKKVCPACETATSQMTIGGVPLSIAQIVNIKGDLAMIIGLTGSIASGKSTVAKMMSELGLPIVDADVVARDVVEPGTETLALIAESFGQAILLEDGNLNRTIFGRYHIS